LKITEQALNGLFLPGGGALDGKSWKTIFLEREFRSKSFMGRFNVDILCGHNEDVRDVFLLVSANLIFTSGRDSVVRMSKMEEGLLIDTSRALGGTIRAIAADSRLLVSGGTNAYIQCWMWKAMINYFTSLDVVLARMWSFASRGMKVP
jgi:hypothetical protein